MDIGDRIYFVFCVLEAFCTLIREMKIYLKSSSSKFTNRLLPDLFIPVLLPGFSCIAYVSLVISNTCNIKIFVMVIVCWENNLGYNSLLKKYCSF